MEGIGVKVEDYNDLGKVLKSFPEGSSVAIDENAISYEYKNLTESLGHKVVKLGQNIIQHMKAVKNPVQ